MSGKFITFEGIEGSGKSTQIRILADYLKLRGHEVVSSREPGGTPIGEKIRQVLLTPESKNMQPVTELFLYAAGRCQHVQEVIKPAKMAGKIVLCDRYADATTAYQGAARNIDAKLLKAIHQLATDNLKPDLTVLLDCPVELGLRRIEERQPAIPGLGGLDRFEQEKIEFHEQVRQGYLKIAKAEPKRVRVIDALGDIHTVHEKIVEAVIKIL